MQVNEKEMISLTKRYRLPLAAYAVLKTKADISRLKLSFPVAAKVISKEVLHKTEAGFVKVDLKNKEELASAYDELIAKAKQSKVKVLGILCQEMQEGLECIIGAKRDPQFGAVVMFGFGGIFVELFKDTSLRIAPLSQEDAIEMIKETKAGKILSGYRGKSYRVDHLVEILMQVSRLMEKEKHIIEIDLNPVIVNQKTARIVDVRMMY